MTARKLYSLFLLLFCLGWRHDAVGQINLNIHNGLPSNHVYQMVKDKYGYLWITTTNGVVRYNGYGTKTYNITDGLPSNDVWSIHLDSKGRLWLLCYANTPGYIYKNKYRETYVKNYPHGIATTRVAEYGEGITFTTKFQEATGHSLFIEKNDTLVNLRNDWAIWWFYINNRAEFIRGWNNSTNSIQTYEVDGAHLHLKRSCDYDSSILFLKNTLKLTSVFYDHEVYYNSGKNILYSLSFLTCKLDTFFFPAPITKVLTLDKHLLILAGETAYKLDSNLSPVYSIPVEKITGGYVTSADDIVYLVEDPFWGKAIATLNNGIYILPWKESPFRKLQPFDNQGYKYVGAASDSIGYWWNAYTGTMAYLDENGTRTYHKTGRRDVIGRILPYTNGRSLAHINYAIRFINPKTLTTSNLHMFVVPRKTTWFRHDLSEAIIHKDTIYNANSAAFCKDYISNDTFFIDFIHNDRFTGVLYDSLRKFVWGYNLGKIVLYRNGVTAVILNTLKGIGLNRFDQILLDNKHGNIFIKDGNRVLCLNPVNYSCQQLFAECNLADARLFIQDGILIATGKFGILFSQIYGAGKISEPVIYFNDKYNYYLTIYGVQVSKHRVLMNTDNGLYAIDLPNEHSYRGKKPHQPFSLILSYGDDLRKAHNHDSIFLSQDNRKLVFDIVKPSGSGQVKYEYIVAGIDFSWQEIANKELNLVDLQPGKYYSLVLKVSDDVWKSKPIKLHVHVIPYWWQTNPGRTILWLLAIVVLSGLILATVAITRKTIIRNNQKKNRLLELEIKSIHSQINPHFIFNTLNTTLHYIVKKKLDEAYDHISSFSSLLRAYLKSSRNRYITLGEEITNLRNYIHLQQTRFENKFTYEIITDIPAGKTVDIPSLLLQPIVENAINHGLLPKNAPGHLKLSFIAEKNTNKLTCIVDDDGIGRKKNNTEIRTDTPMRESYGDQLIKELVDIFNKYENAGIEIHYVDKQLPETGTTVIITIQNAINYG